MSLSLSVLLWWNWWYPCCFAILICWICEGVVLKLLSCVGNLASLKEDDQSRSSFDSQPSCGTRQLQCCPYFLNQLLFDGMEFEHFLHLQCCFWSSSTDIREKNSSHGRPSTSRRGNWWMCQICLEVTCPYYLFPSKKFSIQLQEVFMRWLRLSLSICWGWKSSIYLQFRHH